MDACEWLYVLHNFRLLWCALLHKSENLGVTIRGITGGVGWVWVGGRGMICKCQDRERLPNRNLKLHPRGRESMKAYFFLNWSQLWGVVGSWACQWLLGAREAIFLSFPSLFHLLASVSATEVWKGPNHSAVFCFYFPLCDILKSWKFYGLVLYIGHR